jgi:cellulose synthase/poly-beta-1,6-N-acetylglucosamine synthase-like glycosyltransferase
MLFLISLFGIQKYRRDLKLNNFMLIYQSKLTPPISLIVPAYNEENTILNNIETFLYGFNYPEYEVVVVNDGSSDKTLKLIIEKFDCEVYDSPYKKSIETKNILGMYRSKKDRRLIVVDKENGGKADALNVGINISSFPYFGSIDADTILEKDSYFKVMLPVLNNPDEVVATGGIVGVINGCKFSGNNIQEIRFQGNILEKLQVIEYLRAFLFGRYAWTVINALPLISGAFGLFQKKAVIECGGYSTEVTKKNTVGEDMELVIRLHKYLKKNKRKYKIVFVPDPLSWTQVPSDIKTLKNQRSRWHRGLMETILRNKALLFNPKYGNVGLLSMPYYLIFEMLSPIIELMGYLLIPYFYFRNLISIEIFSLFFIFSVLFGVFISVCAVFLETITFNRYKSNKTVSKIYMYAILENFGYRQITLIFRLIGFFQYIFKYKKWGKMKRNKI